MILIYDTFFTLKFEKNIQISWPTLTEGLERPSGMKKIIAVLGPSIVDRNDAKKKKKKRENKIINQQTNLHTPLSVKFCI